MTLIMLPLTLEHADKPVFNQLLAKILSCTNKMTSAEYSNRTVSTPNKIIKFANSSISLFDNREKYDELLKKILGLVLHFCASASGTNCIAILNIAPTVISDFEILSQITEETLHAHFTHQDGNAMTTAATALQIPISNILTYAQTCTRQQTSTLSLAVIMWRLINSESDSLAWNNNAGWSLAVILDYKPISVRNFDMIAIWFTALCIVNNSLFNPEIPSIATVLKKLKKKLKDEGSSSQSTPNLRLACRACFIYLERLLADKSPQDLPLTNSSSMSRSNSLLSLSSKSKALLSLLPNSNLDLPQLMEQLQKLQSQEMYSGNTFSAFFMEIETILAPLCDLNQFKLLIVKTLFPFAPYLANT